MPCWRRWRSIRAPFESTLPPRAAFWSGWSKCAEDPGADSSRSFERSLQRRELLHGQRFRAAAVLDVSPPKCLGHLGRRAQVRIRLERVGNLFSAARECGLHHTAKALLIDDRSPRTLQSVQAHDGGGHFRRRVKQTWAQGE